MFKLLFLITMVSSFGIEMEIPANKYYEYTCYNGGININLNFNDIAQITIYDHRGIFDDLFDTSYNNIFEGESEINIKLHNHNDHIINLKGDINCFPNYKNILIESLENCENKYNNIKDSYRDCNNDNVDKISLTYWQIISLAIAICIPISIFFSVLITKKCTFKKH